MARQHSPGPWSVNDHGTLIGGDGAPVISTTPVYRYSDKHQHLVTDRERANGALILHAPDLLAIAETILERGYVCEFIDEERSDYEELRLAVSRARGTLK